MPKKIGLPDDFAIKVPESARARRPIRVQDELDREIANRDASAAPEQVGETASAAPVAAGLAPPIALEPQVPAVEPAVPVRASPARERKKPVRKELSLDASIAGELDELVDHFRTYSVQKDVSASEIIACLVSALHEARQHLSLGQIPPRGQWGSQNARNFRTNMKNAAAQAIYSGRQTP